MKISDLSEEEIVTRELALLKVIATDQNRGAILEIVDIFRGEIIDVSPDTVIVEVTGTEEKVDAAFEMLKPYGVREMARTGRVAVTRGRSTATLELDEVGREAIPSCRPGEGARGQPPVSGRHLSGSSGEIELARRKESDRPQWLRCTTTRMPTWRFCRARPSA